MEDLPIVGFTGFEEFVILIGGFGVFEWGRLHNHSEEYDSASEDVSAFALVGFDFGLIGEFRGIVLWGSYVVGGVEGDFSSFFIDDLLAESEVGEFEGGFFGEEDVFGLDVAMDDSAFVEELQSLTRFSLQGMKLPSMIWWKTVRASFSEKAGVHSMISWSSPKSASFMRK